MYSVNIDPETGRVVARVQTSHVIDESGPHVKGIGYGVIFGHSMKSFDQAYRNALDVYTKMIEEWKVVIKDERIHDNITIK